MKAIEIQQEESVNERIRKICKFFYKNNASEMAREIDVPQSTLRDIIGNKGNKPSYDTLEAVIKRTKRIDSEWLMIGKGEMLKSEIEIARKNNEQLKEQAINVYNLDEMSLEKLFKKNEENVIGTVVIPDLPISDGAVRVRGDSMAPLLKSGDIVIYKEVDGVDSVIYGEMYLIEVCVGTQVFMGLKYIRKSSMEGRVLLTCYNTEYDPMEVKLTDIVGMALIKASIRFNTMM